MKENSNKLNNKIRNINEQLSNTFCIVFKRLMDLEKENENRTEAVLNNISYETDKILSKPTVPLEDIKINECTLCLFESGHSESIYKYL